jgi:hypothetical protein
VSPSYSIGYPVLEHLIPIVIENQTKSLKGFHKDLDRFQPYLAQRYEPEVEVSTLTEFAEETAPNPSLVRKE